MKWIEAQPAAHGAAGALRIPRPFVQLRQGIKELVDAQMPVLSLLARPVVEELRVAQREACQERTAGQVRGLLELRKPRFPCLFLEWFYQASYLLPARFAEAQPQP